MTSNAGVAAGRDIINSPTTIIQSDNAEILRAIDDLTRKVVAYNPGQAMPATDVRVGQAIGNIARGAVEGDEQLQTALEFLREGKVADAVWMLQVVADDKAARIKQDSKDAAAAYRNLGAIAGLGDPRRALDAYLNAVEYDPDDVESLLWIGWIELQRGCLDAAEQRFRGVLTAEGEGEVWSRFWARLGLGDIRVQRGDLSVARADYLKAAALANCLSKADPGNAGWQRDLSVTHNRIGDVQRAQGDLPAALRSYQASHNICDRLAKADPSNAGWQRDLALSFGRLAIVEAQQGACDTALSHFREGRDIVASLVHQSPENATLTKDIEWFHDKIGMLER